MCVSVFSLKGLKEFKLKLNIYHTRNIHSLATGRILLSGSGQTCHPGLGWNFGNIAVARLSPGGRELSPQTLQRSWSLVKQCGVLRVVLVVVPERVFRSFPNHSSKVNLSSSGKNLTFSAPGFRFISCW